MERPGKKRALDEVFFNYNPIYDSYESLWFSSTWPIKVLLQGTLEKLENHTILKTSARFKIENDVTEYVKDELIYSDQDLFNRETHVRTDEADDWYHHMTETAKRIN